MIKFFRNIRKQLIGGKNTGKYLKYAIGEIILVVIGILIALQINNWNEKRKLKRLEHKYLTEIRDNLLKDLTDIDYNIDFNKGIMHSNNTVLRYLKNEIPYADSLEFHFGNLLGVTRTIVNLSAYENLKSRGLEIISNDSLRQSITHLYEFSIYNLQDFESKSGHVHQYQVLWPEVIKAVNIVSYWEKGMPIKEEEILNNFPLRNAISSNVFFRQFTIDFYTETRANVEALISHIDEHL